MELFLYCIAAMALGILIGLLPSLPVFMGPLLILPVAQHISTEVMLMVWILTVIGAQYFGSVSVITTKIPGEENTLIYLRDLDSMSIPDKISLLYGTALGSLVAGVLGVLGLALGFYSVHISNPTFFSQAWIQALVYAVLLLSFAIMAKKQWFWAVVLMALGLLLSTKNNYALPGWWIDIQSFFDGKTLFMITLGLLIIPYSYQQVNINQVIHDISKPVTRHFPWLTSVGASVVGFVAGLIPGPSAYTASYMAYQMSKDPKTKIIAAESANNSAVIATALPVILTAIPINQSTLLLLAALDLNQINISQAVWTQGSTGLTILNQLLIAILGSSIVYYFLSINFINYYVKVIEFFHNNTKVLLTALLISMCAIDIYTSNSDFFSYLALTSLFATVGIFLHYVKINSLPLLFSIIIGDRLVWSFMQVYHIYF